MTQPPNFAKSPLGALALGALALGALAALIGWLVPVQPDGKEIPSIITTSPSVPEPPRPVEAVMPHSVPLSEAGTVAYETPVSLGDDPFAPSLKGTEIDGALRANARGELILDLATRDFFDYFLNTVGEVSPEQALEVIEGLATKYLPESAAEAAMALLDDYLHYRQQALALSQRPLDPARQQDPQYQLSLLRATFADLKQARRESFSPQAHDAFFTMEEAYSDYTLSALELRQRSDLSREARELLVQWHRDQLPESLRLSKERQETRGRRNRERQQALAEAASPQQAQEKLRALGMESAQAESVARYLSQRERFTASYQDYQQALIQLEGSGVSPLDREKAREALLKSHFEDERERTWARLEGLGEGR